jgi:predicted enzyme related to lactoylglutathione lyase
VLERLASPDFDTSTAFYGGLFGWEFEPFAESPQPYLSIRNNGRSNGGIRELGEGPPPHWLVYFAVDDVEDSLAKLEELGGTKHAGPIDIQMAKIGIVGDSQGAIFALYAGVLEP